MQKQEKIYLRLFIIQKYICEVKANNYLFQNEEVVNFNNLNILNSSSNILDCYIDIFIDELKKNTPPEYIVFLLDFELDRIKNTFCFCHRHTDCSTSKTDSILNMHDLKYLHIIKYIISNILLKEISNNKSKDDIYSFAKFNKASEDLLSCLYTLDNHISIDDYLFDLKKYRDETNEYDKYKDFYDKIIIEIKLSIEQYINFYDK